jgi:hypothetical protein
VPSSTSSNWASHTVVMLGSSANLWACAHINSPPFRGISLMGSLRFFRLFHEKPGHCD